MAIDIFPLCLASLRHPAGNTPLSEGKPCITMYQNDVSCTSAFLLFRPWVFSRALGYGGTDEASVNTVVQVWALVEVRGTCSGD